MKKFIFVALAFVAMSFASCGNGSQKESAVENDTTVVDTLAQDSIIVNDSIQ